MEQLTHRPLSEADKRDICAWRYDGDYAIYNLDSYEDMRREGYGFCRPDAEKNYLGFFEQERLVGFVNICEKETEVSIGIGVHPSYCSRGYGREILRQTVILSQERHPGKPLYLEVRTWNTRAIRCYQAAGFSIDGQPYELVTGIGPGVFYRMVKA